MQVNSLSFNMSRDKKFAHLKQENESPDDFMQRLRIMLKDPKQQLQFYDYVNAKSSNYPLKKISKRPKLWGLFLSFSEVDFLFLGEKRGSVHSSCCRKMINPPNC